MAFLRILLFPFSLLYNAITRVRNHFYNIGYKPSFRFGVTVISVGNLNAGGSGKTPMTEYLIRLLSPDHKLATLSRGYGRRTRGLLFAADSESAATVGDEPYQFYRKYGDDVLVTVCEDRVFAIPNILQQEPSTDIILMDDGFQHRAVSPQLSILLTEYAHPFYQDWLLPTGNLRESRTGAQRADIIVVTKCPTAVHDSNFQSIETSVHQYAPGKPVFFSRIEYGDPVAFGSQQNVTTDVVLVSGIANSKPLEEYVASRFNLVRHVKYRDHRRFTIRDIEGVHVKSRSHPNPISILTTEKDMVKLIDRDFKGLIDSMAWFYVPVRVSFLKNGSDFDSLVRHAIRHHENSNAQ